MLRLYSNIFLLICLAACVDVLHAQHNPTRLYTVGDGLLQTECASVYLDRQGRLWIGHTEGLTIYDGREFQVRSKDIPAGGIYEDRWGNLWMTGVSGNPPVMLKPDGRKVAFQWDVSLRSPLPERIPAKAPLPVGRFEQGQERNIHWVVNDSLRGWHYSYLYEETTVSFVKTDSVYLPDYPIVYFHNHRVGGDIVLGIRNGRRYFFHKEGPRRTTLMETPPGLDDRTSSVYLFPLRRDTVWLDDQGGFFHWAGGERTSYLPEVNEMLRSGWQSQWWEYDAERIIVLLGNEEGEYQIHEYSWNLQLVNRLRFRFRSDIQRLERDHAGNYWLPSHGGLLKVYAAFTHYFSDSNPVMLPDIHALAEDKEGRMWFGSYGAGFGYVQDGRVYRGPPALQGITRVLPGSLVDVQGRPLFVIENPKEYRGLIRIRDGKPEQLLSGVPGYYLARDRAGRLLYGTNHEGLYVGTWPVEPGGDWSWRKIGKDKGFGLTNVLTVVEDTLGRYWMGRPSAGLAVYLPERDTVLSFIRGEHTRLGFWSSALDAKGRLWFGTSEGLALLSPPAHIDTAFRPDRHLQMIGREVLGAAEIRGLTVYRDQYLVLLGDKHFALLDLASFDRHPAQPLIYRFGPDEGYAGEACEQNAVWIDDRNQIWFANDKGITTFHPRRFLPDTIRPVVAIDSLRTQTGGYTPHPGRFLRLDQHDHNIRIDFRVANSSVYSGETVFYYQLNGDSLQRLDDRYKTYENLRHGKYVFTVYAQRYGRMSEPAVVQFRIPRSTTENPWFYALLTLLLVAGLFEGWRQRERRRRQILALRVQTVVNQLNPHFINNALNWVQIRARKANDPEAIAIIGKLAQNIKTIFRNSREKRSHHSLGEEMQLVENYFHIQRARFGEKLQYHLPEAADIQTWSQVETPLMLLQIHCENAVEHGVRNRKTGGYVKISFTDQGERLHFVVEDNGVGRRKAKEIGSLGTQQGTKMLAELIEVFNSGNRLKIKQSYEDEWLTDENGDRYGTRVHLLIPKEYNYEFAHFLRHS